MPKRAAALSIGVLSMLVVAGCGGDSGEPAAEAPAPPPAAPAAAPAGGAVAEGQAIFTGAGICFTCHGQAGEGTALGPALNDDEWIWIDPAADLQPQLVAQIRAGTPEPRDFPAPMPPMGGASLTDQQLESVAAYVASLSQ